MLDDLYGRGLDDGAGLAAVADKDRDSLRGAAPFLPHTLPLDRAREDDWQIDS
jgi:hypothetical protein